MIRPLTKGKGGVAPRPEEIGFGGLADYAADWGGIVNYY